MFAKTQYLFPIPSLLNFICISTYHSAVVANAFCLHLLYRLMWVDTLAYLEKMYLFGEKIGFLDTTRL
jgi:hypothetical protein